MTPNKDITPFILIPVYKDFEDLDSAELASLDQLVTILAAHPIGLFGPEKIDWQKYLKYFSARDIAVTTHIFDAVFFTNVDGYSKLLLSLDFYKRFAAYSHLLIYQLDAYVFSDELLQWCKAGYDYIGAPWIDNRDGIVTKGELTGVGNGGLSLRKTDSFIRVLTSKKRFKSFRQLVEEYKRFPALKQVSRMPVACLRALTGWRNNGAYHAQRFLYNEDLFWGLVVKESYYPFKLPPVEKAAQFSFEIAPEHLFRLNKQQLPFGCHAWFKYEPEFWQRYIQW
ncbi:DUF5672 family protein [Flavisolibacter ginsenosidimutans]|uniref:DUF5672 domain-containing protein n=1 Tax=Flavisolibacter ginsenosidimutans TaxID=661481 RepID=A0A5B8UPU0_9BACT|nr:DUF5672 family protein [Flavisolibacter ginsenosidimutans]QEC58259.1 hypothetical protein FSB75_20895 [Flavisolibacter ginsenosidimutans]